ncbi:MAG: hypothetical protein RL038_988 [Actinomycetota bacterium]|jgi:catechol 2,3-dioxygenase-like lactoylglutathione lyase family enzyme
MKLSYVVLYCKDSDENAKFWTEQLGMVKKDEIQIGEHKVIKVGFVDQTFSFELVPLELMQENPDGLDLATPSIAFEVENIEELHTQLSARGVKATEPNDHMGRMSFAFADNEERWFAVLKA